MILVQDMFIGGTKTSSTTIKWAMSKMMRNPRAMEKAQAEIKPKSRKSCLSSLVRWSVIAVADRSQLPEFARVAWSLNGDCSRLVAGALVVRWCLLLDWSYAI
ncbi:unnamed protein product [Ilex paraguariensis]|uniref:Uncharacterized protein n=1 Tax=Ilex paraguariensis TaxID=185542 RepID=A0ABC8RZY3_9AQUA